MGRPFCGYFACWQRGFVWCMGGRIFAAKGRLIVATTVHKFKCKSLPHMQLLYIYMCMYMACGCIGEHKWFCLIVEALFGSRKLKFICKSFGNLWYSHSDATHDPAINFEMVAINPFPYGSLKIILVRRYVYL